MYFVLVKLHKVTGTQTFLQCHNKTLFYNYSSKKCNFIN